MSYRSNLFFFLFLFLSPLFAFAGDMELTGAGTSAVNGCYIDQLDETWISESTTYEIFCADNQAILHLNAGGGSIYYTSPSHACTSAAIDTASWNVDSGGSPAPSVSLTTCEEEPPPEETATGTATTTPASYADFLLVNLILIFIATIIVLLMIRREFVFNKKHDTSY